jgi:PilZ domain
MVPILALSSGTTRPLPPQSSAVTLEVVHQPYHVPHPAQHGPSARIAGPRYRSSKMNKELSKPIHRLRRYQINSSLQYRVHGERVWHQGVSRNMSETGILFKAEGQLSDGAHFDARLTLPTGSDHHRRTSISFQAVVVRCDADGVCAAHISARRLCRSGLTTSPHSRRGPATAPPEAGRRTVVGVRGAA